MVADDIRLRTRHELEEAGLSMDAASYLVDDRPPGGWDSLVTKDLLRAELAELRQELHGEMAQLRTDVNGALSKQTWRLAMLVVAAQAVVVAAIGGIVAALTG